MEPNDTHEPGVAALSAALARHELHFPLEQVALLDRFRALLWSWNERLNLTRHTELEKFVARDVVDSMAFSRFLEQGERVLDLGTGGGVPGVILAIVRPDLTLELCDSVGKKARAVGEIVKELGLGLPVHALRGQELLGRARYDSIVVRAVAPLGDLAEWLVPHTAAFRRALVLKGPRWLEERKKARERGVMRTLALRRLWSYPLAGADGESVLLELRRKEPGSAESDLD